MMTDYMFGTGLDEVVKSHAMYNFTYVYNFAYYSWNDYLPPWRGNYISRYFYVPHMIVWEHIVFWFVCSSNHLSVRLL